ncbi:hypothetical protein RJ639_023139 [Escallonia herrerae]|uniref:KIB1-4 beta-propeller domain-containing protein n=1 Tax=Escallonia herrerae TaxID=1293975 RepID=A0AA89AEW4_9ASTE|nr:hypothetical protein RJ639_023139 [Escallonia herrerae]
MTKWGYLYAEQNVRPNHMCSQANNSVLGCLSEEGMLGLPLIPFSPKAKIASYRPLRSSESIRYLQHLREASVPSTLSLADDVYVNEAMDTTRKKKEELVHLLPPLASQPNPWLLACDGKHLQRQTFFNVSENCHHSRKIPQLRNKRVWASNYGFWVLQYEESGYFWLFSLANKNKISPANKNKESGDFSLLNLANMEESPLPRTKSPPSGCCTCILSSSPSDPDCHIFFVAKNSIVFFRKGADGEFVKHELIVNFDVRSTTTFQGKLYCTTYRGDALVVADFSSGSLIQFRQLIPERPAVTRPHGEGVLSQDHLMESCGELWCVFMFFSGSQARVVTDFEVYRADFTEMAWVKLDDIGERTIFCSPRRGMSYSAAEAKTKANCVYFTLLHDRNLYVFDFDDRSISVSLPCPRLDRPEFFEWVRA